MDIRELNSNDAIMYRLLRLKSLKTHPEAFGSSYEEEEQYPMTHYEQRLTSADGITFGAFDDNKLIGMITMRYGSHQKTKHSGHIYAMYVDDSYRRQSVGYHLVQKVIDYAKQLNIINLFLTVTSTNTQAIKLYEKCGFVAYGTEKREIYVNGIYYDSLLMAFYL